MPRNKFAATAGIRVYMGDAANAVNTLVAGMRKITGMPEEVDDEFETTALDQQTAGGDVDWYKQFGFAFTDPGNFAAAVGCDEDMIEALRAARRLDKFWEIRLRSGAKIAFPGVLNKIGGEAPEKGEFLTTINIRLTGAVTFSKSNTALPSVIEGGVTKTASYDGAALDLGASFAPSTPISLAAALVITALDLEDEDETYSAVLEESADNVTFTPCGPAMAITELGTLLVPGFVELRYIRCALTVGGTTPSITYSTGLRRI